MIYKSTLAMMGGQDTCTMPEMPYKSILTKEGDLITLTYDGVKIVESEPNETRVYMDIPNAAALRRINHLLITYRLEATASGFSLYTELNNRLTRCTSNHVLIFDNVGFVKSVLQVASVVDVSFLDEGKIIFPIGKLMRYTDTTGGYVDEYGQHEVKYSLRRETGIRLPDDWEWDWVISKGKYAGTLPKRIANYAYKELGVKLNPQFLGALGALAKQYVPKGGDFIIDFNKTLRWRRGNFGNQHSCFWSGRRNAKTIMRNNGVCAMRLYSDSGDGIGRAWVAPNLPCKGMAVLFNGYRRGDGFTLGMARMLASVLGMSYKKIILTNRGTDSGTLWINSGIGYLIGTPEQLLNYGSYDLCMY